MPWFERIKAFKISKVSILKIYIKIKETINYKTDRNQPAVG